MGLGVGFGVGLRVGLGVGFGLGLGVGFGVGCGVERDKKTKREYQCLIGKRNTQERKRTSYVPSESVSLLVGSDKVRSSKS